jgi:hypothetical protein
MTRNQESDWDGIGLDEGCPAAILASKSRVCRFKTLMIGLVSKLTFSQRAWSLRNCGRRLKPSAVRGSCIALFCALCGAIIAPLPAGAQANVLTFHNDNARTGQNLNETNLTLANVNASTFGLLFSCPVDGQLYAQPLYMAAVSITNKGTHNVVFAATENDSVFAFDADSNTGSNAPPLWQVSFINPAAGVTTVPTADVGSPVISPVIGITSTPVIDPTTMTLYVLAKTKEVSGTATHYINRLHALDVGSGAEKFGGPVVIQPVVAGTGEGNDGAGHVLFDGLRHMNRSGLLLANGVVYVAFASHADVLPYHGWVLGFNAQTLQPQGVFNSTPNGAQGGFWQAGGGPASDTAGNIYIVSGNGTFDGTTNNDYGDSFLKLTPDGTNLVLADYFTPYNQLYLSTNDLDEGSGGVVVLPDAVGSAAHPHLVLGGGKDGILHLVDRDTFGEYNPTNNNQIVQSLEGVGGNVSTPAYFNGTLYYFGAGKQPSAFSFSGGLLLATPSSSNNSAWPGTTPSISANATSNGILWALKLSPNGDAVLHAYNATNLALELYNSQQTGTRDALGAYAKWSVPTVANGKVYVGTAAGVYVLGAILPSVGSLAGIGSGWTLNGGAIVTNDVLTLTDGLEPEARSAYFNSPQYIASFQAQFVYQCSGGADGTAFVLQNSPGGAGAVGGYDGGFGFSGISPSAAIELNICSCTGGTGTLFATNGRTGYPPTPGYTSTLPVNLASGDPIWVILNYDGSNLAEDLVDMVTGDIFNARYAVNLPVAVGGYDWAFVGFSASDGDADLASIQTISDFTFGPIGPAPSLSAAVAGNQITISWPALALNYVLEFTTNLAAPVAWTAAPQTPVVSGSQATVTIPIGTTNTFFRLLTP